MESNEMEFILADLGKVLFDGGIKLRKPQTEVAWGCETEVGVIGQKDGDLVLRRLSSLMEEKIEGQDFEGAARVRATLRCLLRFRFKSEIGKAGFQDADLESGKYHPVVRRDWKVVVIKQSERTRRPFGRVLGPSGKPVISHLG